MTDQPTRTRGDAGRSVRPPAPEPLPHPVADNHCHLDIADGEWLETGAAVAAAAAVNVTRIVQIGCDLPGAAWAVEAAAGASGAGGRGRPASQRGGPAGGRRGTGAGARRDRAARCAPAGAGGGGDRARPLPHRRGGPARPGGELPPARRPRQAAGPDPGDPRPRRPRRRAARHRRRGGARPLGDALLLRGRLVRAALPGPGGLPQLRRHGHLQERRPPARGAGADAPATGCSWRPTRPTSRRCPTAVGPTRRTWSRTPCGRWPRCAARTSTRLCEAIDATTSAAFGGAW